MVNLEFIISIRQSKSAFFTTNRPISNIKLNVVFVDIIITAKFVTSDKEILEIIELNY